MRKPRLDDGFTLIELLVVVIILGILSAIVVFSIGNARENSALRACNANAAQIVRAYELFRSTSATGAYPTADDTVTVVNDTNLGASLVPGILKSIPVSADYTLSVKANKTSGSVYVWASTASSTTLTNTTSGCFAGKSF